METVKKQKLTKKQRGFVKDYVLTENGTQSVLNNYDIKSPNKVDVAKSIASENLSKPYIVEEIEDIKNSVAEALTDELLLKVHLEGLNASNEVRDAEGEVLLEKPDYAVRHKYLDSAYKIKGTYAPEKKAIAHLYNDEHRDKAKEALRGYMEDTE